MSITFRKQVAVFKGVCSVEEAEPLLEWLQSTPRGRINLKGCDHLHTALLQVLMVFRPALSSSPTDREPWCWLLPCFAPREDSP